MPYPDTVAEIKKAREDAENRKQAAEKSKRVSQRAPIICGDQITIMLAGEDQKYTVHKGLVCKRSTFFRKTFVDSRMKESRLGCVELHDADRDILETCIYWLYTNMIQLPDRSDTITSDNSSLFVDLYLFAECYGTRELRNSVVQTVLEQVNPKKPWLKHEVLGDALHKLRCSSKSYGLLLALLKLDIQTIFKTDATGICTYYPRDTPAVLVEEYIHRGTQEPKGLSHSAYIEYE